MMKRTIMILAMLVICAAALAQTEIKPVRDSIVAEIPDSLKAKVATAADSVRVKPEVVYTDEFLDTVKLNKKLAINDYSMIGVQYGMALSQMMFNPTKKQGMLSNPGNIGVTYTRYGKMFGYMPYFGFQTGIFYGKSGYKFKKDKKTGEYTESVDGAEKAVYSYVEVPALAHMHMDVWHLKFIANVGLFAAYRVDVEREGATVPSAYLNKFYDYERRFEYGVKAGLGIGIIFDPVELHLQATYRYSMGSLYKPDYASEYYYRFAYPSDIIISAGLHFQLTKRTGKTRSQLKKIAKQIVYETDENTDSNSR